MKFLNILVLAIKKSCKILWVPIMPETQILWVPGFFLNSWTFHNCLLLLTMGSRGWKKSKDCLYSRKKIWMQQGLNLWLQGERPAPKPLNHEDFLIFWGLHLPFGWTCYVCLLTELISLQTSQADVCKVCEPCLWTVCHKALVFSSTVAPKRCCLCHWM